MTSNFCTSCKNASIMREHVCMNCYDSVYTSKETLKLQNEALEKVVKDLKAIIETKDTKIAELQQAGLFGGGG